MSATAPTQPSAAAFTFAPALVKYDVQMEKYLASLQETTTTPLYGLATGVVVFSKHHTTASEPRVLLVQRAPTDSMPLKWEIPGGAVDAGETILAGAVREVREEAGLAVTRIVSLVVHDEAGGQGEGIDGGYLIRTTRGKRIPKYTFLADVEDSDCVRLDPEEHQDYVWATEEECRAKRAARDAAVEGGDVVELDFTTGAQEEAILNAFVLRKHEMEAS